MTIGTTVSKHWCQLADLTYTAHMSPAATLRQRHADRTRAAIVSAAMELFAASGFQATTIDDIAERADIAPRTFFRYFPTKEAVLFADAGAKRERIAGWLAARPADEHPLRSLTSVVADLAEGVAAEADVIKLRSQIAAENPAVWAYERTMLEADMADTLAAFVAGRLDVSMASDPRPRVWAAVVMTTFRIAFHQWLDGGQQGPLRQAVDHALAAAAEAADLLRPPTAPA
jgi:AcrR family transcriptional regulator